MSKKSKHEYVRNRQNRKRRKLRKFQKGEQSVLEETDRKKLEIFREQILVCWKKLTEEKKNSAKRIFTKYTESKGNTIAAETIFR